METSHQYIEDLILAYHAGELTAAQHDELLQLVQSDSEAAELFRSYAVLRSAMPADEGGHEMAYQQFLASTGARRQRRIPLTVWAAAASIALLAGMFMFLRPQHAQNVEIASAGNHILPDSSQITAGQGTELAYSPDFSAERTVSLKRGQAFFEIKHDSKRPFTVNLPNASVRVLGTSFNLKIDSLSGNSTLTVLTGRVQASAASDKESRILNAGESMIFSSAGLIAEEPVHADGNELSWKTGRLVFTSAPMADVVRAINNHFGSALTLEDHAMDSCRLNATFAQPELPKILDMLKIAFDVQLVEKDGKLILRGPGC